MLYYAVNGAPQDVAPEPASKRIRRMACPCDDCNGRERDHRTVQKHMKIMASQQQIVNPLCYTVPNDTLLESPPSSEHITTQSQHIAVETSVSEFQPTEEQKMTEFVMKELQVINTTCDFNSLVIIASDSIR